MDLDHGITSIINHLLPDSLDYSKINSNILAILPYNKLKTIDTLNLNLTNLLEIKKHNYFQDYEQAQSIANHILSTSDSILLDNIIKSEIISEIIFAYQNLYTYDDTYLVLLNNLDSLVYKEPTIKLYYKVKSLSFRYSYHSYFNRNFQALSCLEYGLHLIAKSNYNTQFLYLKAMLLRSKGSLLINESHPGAEQTAIHCLETSRELFQQLGLINDHTLSIINLFNIDLNDGPYIPIDSLQKLIAPNLIHCSPRIQYYYTLNLAYYYLINSQFNKALTAFKELESASNNNPCSFFSFNTYANLAEVYLELDSLAIAEKYINKSENFRKCNAQNGHYVNFYSNELKYEFLRRKRKTTQSIEFDTLINTLLLRRKSATKIFTNESEFHLEDFYTKNCTRIIDIIHSEFQEEIPVKYQLLTIQLFYDTKQRQLKRNHYLSQQEPNPNNQIDQQIESCLRITNDFNKTNDYKNLVYEKLYSLYQKKNYSYKDLANVSLIDLINIEKHEALNLFLSNSTSILYNFIKYNEFYYAYLNDGTDFKLEKFHSNVVDSLIQSYNNQILDLQPTYAATQKELSEHLFNFQLSKYKSLIFIPDGYLNLSPISALVLSLSQTTRSYINHDIITLINSKKSYINLDKASVSCFSSEQTINDHNPKKLRELNYGLLECKAISNNLSITDTTYGEDFTKSSFLNSLDNEFLHITTHGLSDGNIRNNCYLVARNEKDTSLIFVDVIRQVTKVPKYVCLSSCETGIGQYVISSGVYSFSRAFINAGTESVIKTLWKIDDQASMEFIIQFYDIWSQGVSINDAIHLTKKSFINNSKYSHPYFWDGFVLEGNPELYIKSSEQ